MDPARVRSTRRRTTSGREAPALPPLPGSALAGLGGAQRLVLGQVDADPRHLAVIHLRQMEDGQVLHLHTAQEPVGSGVELDQDLIADPVGSDDRYWSQLDDSGNLVVEKARHGGGALVDPLARPLRRVLVGDVLREEVVKAGEIAFVPALITSADGFHVLLPYLSGAS